MSWSSSRGVRWPAPARAVAIATAVSFGCATVRELPPPPPSPPVARVHFAEPELELWVEGASRVDPAESQRALAESRAAIRAALEGRGVGPADPEAVLYLRERAVARTSGRKTNQALAVAGMVVGVVVIVAVVVISLASGKGKSGGAPAIRSPAARTAARTAPAPRPAAAIVPARGAAPRAAAAGVAAAATRPPSPGSHGTAPAPPPGGPAHRTAPASAHRTAPAPAPGTVVSRRVPVPVHGPGPHVQPVPHVGIDLYLPLEGSPEPYYVEAYAPPPPPAFSMEDRGFFDGDEVLLELVLQDAKSGAILWSAAVHGDGDPRNRASVESLLERALERQPWGRRPAGATARPG